MIKLARYQALKELLLLQKQNKRRRKTKLVEEEEEKNKRVVNYSVTKLRLRPAW